MKGNGMLYVKIRAVIANRYVQIEYHSAKPESTGGIEGQSRRERRGEEIVS